MRHRFLIGAIVVAVVFFILLWTNQKSKKEQVVLPSGVVFNSWRGITPGTSTLTDVINTLGPPASSTQKDGQTVLSYPSANPYWKNEVTATGGTVSFVRERLFAPAERSLKTLSSKLSAQPIPLYGADFASGFVLYVYPEEGLGYYALSDGDTVYEVWRFSPTTLSVFLSLPEASGYGLAPARRPE